MQKCPVLTEEEFGSMVNGRWALSGNARPESIPFTFNTKSIPVESYLFTGLSFDTKIEVVSDFGKDLVRVILQQWENVCGNKIRFKEMPSIKPLQAGMVIAGCSNLKDAAGATYINFDTTGNFYKVVACIRPSTNFTSVLEFEDYLNVAAHELGHSVGLRHTHSIGTLLRRLAETIKGLSCSVMTYVNEIGNEKTQCRGVKNCGENGFATLPGPIDAEVCQNLYSVQYDMRRPNILLQITHLGVTLIIPVVKTGLELIFTGFFSNLRYQQKPLIPKKYIDSATEVAMGLLLYYFEFPVELQTATFAAALANFLIQSETDDVAMTTKLITNLLSCVMMTYTIIHALGSGDALEIIFTLLLMLTFKFLMPKVPCFNPSFLGNHAASLANDIIQVGDNCCDKIKQDHFNVPATSKIRFFQSEQSAIQNFSTQCNSVSFRRAIPSHPVIPVQAVIHAQAVIPAQAGTHPSSCG